MKFTIIIPIYNMEKYIEKVLNSLLFQTYQNFEVIIVDDGSTDATKQIIEPFLKNQNYRYFWKNNGNWGSVINYVLKNKLINGDYVTILDGDDWFKNNALEIVVKRLNKNRKIDVVLSKLEIFSRKKRFNLPVILFKSQYVKSSKARTPLSTPHGKFYKRNLFETLNPLKENVSYQDVILYHRLISKSQCIFYINKAFTIWWIDRPDNSTQKKWNDERVNLWLDNLEEINLDKSDKEIVAYSLMYLWELKRHINFIPKRKIKLNTKHVKFKWFPWYVKLFFPIKTYFKLSTKKFIEQSQ